MRMVRWMCGIKVRDRFPSKELRERSGIDDIAKQAAIEYEMEGPRPRRRPKRTWREVGEKDCQARKLLWIVVKWRKLIKDVR